MFQIALLAALWLGTSVIGDDNSPAFELKGRFIQITDMHPDRFYLEGSLVRLACHKMEKDHNGTVVRPPKYKYNRTDPAEPDPYGTLGSDFDENDNRTAGHFGTPDAPCDTPYSLINATFEYIEKVWKDKIDFIVWTGDNERHDIDNHFPRSPSDIYNSNKAMRDKFYEIFKRDNPLYPLTIPIIPSYGNNDVWPHNIFAPGPNYQTRSYAALWSDMIPEYELHTFERGGYFASEVIPNKLAVISLNTLYWFSSNAAVDGCDYKSEPGSQQFEWLRVQLKEYRKRGVKVYLTGHVPPGKKFYYPSCFRRYALWSYAFRDVILGHLYGHYNVDHFFFLDAKQAQEEEEEAQLLKYLVETWDLDPSTFSLSELNILNRLLTRDISTIVDSPSDYTALGVEEYLVELKEIFRSLPSPPKPPKKWKSGKKGEKQQKKYDEKVREYQENYQVVQVSPSIIPAYFSAIRVFEYNISGLEGHQFNRDEIVERPNWTEWWAQLDEEIAKEKRATRRLAFQQSQLEADVFDQGAEEPLMKPKKPPSLKLPPGPHKSAPRGPVYEPQLLTPLRWEVHFVNLTAANELYIADPQKEWNYSKDFFRTEYGSDAAPYYMKDLTVRSWLRLARNIGNEKAVDKTELLDIGSEEMGEEKMGEGSEETGKKGMADMETYWDVFLRRAFVNSGHQIEFG